MKNKFIVIAIALGGVFILSVFSATGVMLNQIYNKDGTSIHIAYNKNDSVIFDDTIESDIPVPSGNLTASDVIALQDLYEEGKGFTCTGLAYDGTYYYIGDIGTLSGTNYNSKIVVTEDFETVTKTISLKEAFSNFTIVQGVCIDTTDGSIWCCDSNNNRVCHVSTQGEALGSFSITNPTGIAYQSSDDSFWILDYSNKIKHVSKTGVVSESYDFYYNETLDQCFIDEDRGLLYITAGTNYTGRNNVYVFNTNTHEQYIACTVDSYSVEGIWLGDNNKMIILNDGYYHSATVAVNQVNVYTISD